MNPTTWLRALPIVSIGMPVRNCQDSVHAAIASIAKQSYPYWELLVIDDGSTDDTVNRIGEFDDSRIRLVSDGRHLGLSARLNQAISMSAGKYFGRMDGDDISYPQRLEKQVQYIEAHNNVDLVGTGVLVFRAQGQPVGKRIPPKSHAEICRTPFSGFPMAHPTYLGKAEWFQHHRYDESLQRSQDQDLLLRSYLSSEFANIPEILLGYREDRISFRKSVTWRWYFAIAALREFHRQRRVDMALLAVVGQVLKCAVDAVAITSGANYRVLKHRAAFITQEEEVMWRKVWHLVQMSSM